MDVFVTKLVAKLLYPINFALWLSLIGVVVAWRGRRRVGHGAILFALSMLWVASTPVFSGAIRSSLERRYLPVNVERTPSADAIVVLGGGIGTTEPPRLAPDLSAAADRLLHAARLYRAGKAPVVIVSGGAIPWLGSSTPEAQPMATLLQEWGVPEEAITLEMRSSNTYQNAVETKRLLDERGLGPVLLVTSALHMRRALATFLGAKIKAIPAPTDYEVVAREKRTVLDWLPDAEALEGTTRAAGEYLGLVAYRLRGRL